MIVTEKEATERHCPHFPATIVAVRVADNASETAPKDYARCVGKACMAFRFYGWRDQNFQAHKAEPNGNTVEVFYCGLAGQP